MPRVQQGCMMQFLHKLHHTHIGCNLRQNFCMFWIKSLRILEFRCAINFCSLKTLNFSKKSIEKLKKVKFIRKGWYTASTLLIFFDVFLISLDQFWTFQSNLNLNFFLNSSWRYGFQRRIQILKLIKRGFESEFRPNLDLSWFNCRSLFQAHFEIKCIWKLNFVFLFQTMSEV